MPKYAINIGSTFTPFSYNELVTPLMEATTAYKGLRDEYTNLETLSEVFRDRAEKESDSPWAQKYLDYANQLQKGADELSRTGYSISNHDLFSKLKGGFTATISPIEKGIERENQWVKAINEMDSSKRPIIGQMPTLQDFIDNPMARPNIINGSDVEKDFKDLFNSYSSRIINSGIGYSGYSAFAHTIATKGINNETIQEFMQTPVFGQLLQEGLSRYDMSGLSPEQQQQVINEAVTGAMKGMVYEQTDAYQQDPLMLLEREYELKGQLEGAKASKSDQQGPAIPDSIQLPYDGAEGNNIGILQDTNMMDRRQTYKELFDKLFINKDDKGNYRHNSDYFFALKQKNGKSVDIHPGLMLTKFDEYMAKNPNASLENFCRGYGSQSQQVKEVMDNLLDLSQKEQNYLKGAYKASGNKSTLLYEDFAKYAEFKMDFRADEINLTEIPESFSDDINSWLANPKNQNDKWWFGWFRKDDFGGSDEDLSMPGIYVVDKNGNMRKWHTDLDETSIHDPNKKIKKVFYDIRFPDKLGIVKESNFGNNYIDDGTETFFISFDLLPGSLKNILNSRAENGYTAFELINMAIENNDAEGLLYLQHLITSEIGDAIRAGKNKVQSNTNSELE